MGQGNSELLQFELNKMSADLVTCSKVITIHSLESRQPINNYTYHRGFVNSLSINHNNKVIASCGQDGKLFLVSSQKPQNKLIDHNFSPNVKQKPSSLSTCVFSPNSKYIAVGSLDSIIRVWDIRGENTVRKQPSIAQIKSHMCGVTSLAWIKSLKGEQYGSQILASSSSSGDIYLHSNKNGIFSQALALKMQEGINCIRVSEGADYCRLAACTNGGTLAVWDMINGKDKPFWQTSMPNQSKVSLTSLSIGTYTPVLLVTSSMNESLVFFDINEKKVVKTIQADQPLSCVGMHANGHTLVAGGMYGSCFVYDLRNPSKPQNKLAGHQTTIKHLQFFKARERETTSAVTQKNNKASSLVNSSAGSLHNQALMQLKPTSSANIIGGEVKSKQNIKMPEPKVNNLVIPPPSSSLPNNSVTLVNKDPAIEQLGREKKIESKIEPKLSAIGQEVLKNNSVKGQSLSRFTQLSTNDMYRNRQTTLQSSGREVEWKEVKERVNEMGGNLKQLRNQIYQMEERINMSLIRQFQIHQNEMKAMLQAMLSRERQKDERIKRLQAENSRLKNSTF